VDEEDGLEMTDYIIISSCSAGKDDSNPIQLGNPLVTPKDYIRDDDLYGKFMAMRESILSRPTSQLGSRRTLAFDLYVRKGRAYSKLLKENYVTAQKILFDNEVQWFFLSGGYGIINALEEAKKYQASFNYNIARSNNITFTAREWKPFLPPILDGIIENYSPQRVYVFGSRDYTDFIKLSENWENDDVIKILESTGSAGVHWLAPKINDFFIAMKRNSIEEYDAQYSKFQKQ